MKEKWKDIPDYKGIYQVSNMGKVKSLPRIRRNRHGLCNPVPEKILKQNVLKSGHHMVRLYKDGDGSKKDFGVHRLVLLAFVGPCPDGMECCHYDGNPSNNRQNNLRWDTKWSNMEDSKRHGTFALGKSKLTEEQVLEIRKLYREGESKTIMTDLAKKFGLALGTIHPLIKGKTWSHLPGASTKQRVYASGDDWRKVRGFDT